ncbi:unnamed protein product [Camellia sinensis]
MEGPECGEEGLTLKVLFPQEMCLQILIVPVNIFSTQYLKWTNSLADLLFSSLDPKVNFWQVNQ